MMITRITVVLVLVGTFTLTRSAPSLIQYLAQRETFLREERSHFLGAGLDLTSAEQVVNTKLMRDKRLEYNVPEDFFPPAQHFFHAKKDIERSAIFKFIRQMPKGAALHLHDFGAAQMDYVISNVTYRPNLWVRQSDMEFKFANRAPGHDWILLSEMRDSFSTKSDFDRFLEQQLTLTVPDPRQVYTSQSIVWEAFETRFGRLIPMLTYQPVFYDYFWRTLQDYYEDNVMYVEMRGVLPNIYDLQGKEYGALEVATLYRDIAEKFTKEHPDFIGAKFIYAPPRSIQVTQFKDYLETFHTIKTALPNFVAGFDLVSHEDAGRPLIDFIPGLLQMRQQIPETRFFFHAGETNWQGSTDMNLVDAVLLNTTRIGHGYAIVKHPKVLEQVKSKAIGIEISPISNQVLNLVSDLRNHPGAALLSDDYPVVICNDDPGLWGSKGLSYDFYQAFMGLAGKDADLRLLKQLAINSIELSSMSQKEKIQALQQFRKSWTRFISTIFTAKRRIFFLSFPRISLEY